MDFFREIWGYKCSTVLIAAWEIGIFDLLLMKECSVKELAELTQSNSQILEMLIQALGFCGMLEETEEGIKIRPENIRPLQQLKKNQNLLSHEMNLLNRWNHPEHVLARLKETIVKKDYISDAFTIEEQKDYFAAMNEGNLELLLIAIRRECTISSHTTMLEYGRSIGGMSKLCTDKWEGIHCDICVDKAFENVSNELYEGLRGKAGIRILCEEEWNQNTYDFIFLYNSIHYYQPSELIALLDHFYQVLKPGQVLCISDIYAEEKDVFYAGVLLDWITHGGTNQRTFQELLLLVEQTQFKIVKTVRLNQIHNRLLFLTK